MINYLFGWNNSQVVSKEESRLKDDDGCETLAEKIFNAEAAHVEKILKGSFTFFVNKEGFSGRFQTWIAKIHDQAVKAFELCSKEELELLTSKPSKKLLDKSNDLALKVSDMLANQGGLMLVDHLASRIQQQSPIQNRSKSIAAQVVDQHIESYAKKIIQGTVWRYQVLARRKHEDRFIKHFLEKLDSETLRKDFLSELKFNFTDKLIKEYQAVFNENELIELFALQQKHTYQLIEEVIGTPLQKKAVIWITLNF